MRTWPHRITTRLAKMGNNVNQMNHDLVNSFDIDCYRTSSSTRESLYVYEACNTLSAHSKTEERLGRGGGGGGGGGGGMAERRGRTYILGRLRGGYLLGRA